MLLLKPDRTGKLIPIRERLQPSRFSDGKAAVLERVQEHVFPEVSYHDRRLAAVKPAIDSGMAA
jgi:hypothetical protein